MLLPPSSLPANVTCEPLTETSRRTSLRTIIEGRGANQASLRESGATTTVIVKAATFDVFEKKVPVQVPAKSVAACVLDRDGLIVSSPGLAEQTQAVPIVTPDNSSESNRTRNGKDFLSSWSSVEVTLASVDYQGDCRGMDETSCFPFDDQAIV